MRRQSAPTLGLLFAAMVCAVLPAPAATQRELMVVLAETGEQQGNLPVYSRHAEPGALLEALLRGLSGTILRVYAMDQAYLRALEGVTPEPAYVLLSSRQGGYARQGFVLDGVAKPDAGYVDVHRDWPVSGRFGALDQIVPHELSHVIRRQLVGELGEGRANQIHALGVRTDRIVAFNEGFAEHLQALAVEASPGVPEMTRLAQDREPYDRVLGQLAGYRRELEARLAFAPPMRMGFILWYPNAEDILRYYAVRDNVFVRQPEVPNRLLHADPYAAYLLESIAPGAPDGEPKSLSRMLATEGVVASLFYRWALDERLAGHRREPGFYIPFGTRPDRVSDLENLYLKIFAVFHQDRPQSTLDMIWSYRDRFPDEAPWVDEIAREVFLSRPLEDTPEIWLANRGFLTGTTLFDQYRGLPRVHTFDLNAASLVDLVSVPGVDLEMAGAIRAGRPYERVQDLASVPGISPSLVDRFAALEEEMPRLLADLEAEAEQVSR